MDFAKIIALWNLCVWRIRVSEVTLPHFLIRGWGNPPYKSDSPSVKPA